MVYNPYEDYEDCGTFEPSNPYDNDVVTEPYNDCEDVKRFNALSKLYPLEVFDNVDSAGVTITEGDLRSLLKRYDYSEAIDSGVSIIEGELRALLKRYGYLEAIDEDVVIQSGSLENVLVRYDYSEAIEEGVVIQSGSLEDILIRYTNWPIEKIDSAGVTIISGTLEAV